MSQVQVLTMGETMGTIRAGGLLGVGAAPAVSVAGAESNVAIGLSRLGHHAAWTSVLGADAIGDLIVRTLAAERVDTSSVRREESAASGILVSQQRPLGRAQVDYHRTHSAFTTINPADVHRGLELRPRIVHLTGITPALGPGPAEATLAAAHAARDAGAVVSLDVNYRSRLWSREDAGAFLNQIVGIADLVFGDPQELAVLTGTNEPDVPGLLLRGVRQVVIKLGPKGARVCTADTDVTRPAWAVQVADPIGAGDAFVAGYLSGVLDDLSPVDRLERGNACGAAVVSSRGDWEAMLTRADLGSLAAGGDVQR